MNHAQVSRIALSPEVVDCIVFWTKDAKNIMDKLSFMDELGYRYYFQFTLTPYGREMEPYLRDKEEIINTFKELSHSIGTHRVHWRYDPIILNEDFTVEYHLERFENLCSRLNGYTGICTVSFVDLYGKLTKSVQNGLLREITDEEMMRLASGFFRISRSFGIELRACCERLDLSGFGVKHASCIDKATIEEICGCSLDVKADVNQRKGCGCMQSIDIGVYNTCRNGCIYCYANYSRPSVLTNSLKHNPEAGILIGEVAQDEKVILKKMKSYKNYNYSLFKKEG